MKCVIPGINLKVFGRAIHSLSKIGDELYVEPLEQGLALRTVNSSRSAYACFMFFPSYFQHYNDGSESTGSGDNEDEGLRCKLTMRSILTVFRSLSTIEKTVEQCKITHNEKEARLIFQLYCRHGIVKIHNLAYIECETLQAIFSKDLCPNKLTAPAKLLCDVVMNFQTTQEEVTLTVRPDRISMKNYVEDEPDASKVVHTELNLVPDEFDSYQIGVDTDITFCLKELRAILAFAETTNLPLNIHFETTGRPVTFCINSDQTFEASFVLATLAEVDQSGSQQPHSQKHHQPVSHTQHHSKAPASHVHSKNKKATDSAHSSKKQNLAHFPSRNEKISEVRNTLQQICADDIEWDWEERPAKKRSIAGHESLLERPGADNSSPGPSSPIIPVQATLLDTPREEPCLQLLENEDGDEDLNDTIPGTPPAKKFRSLFFGSSQASTQNTQARPAVILAADSDDDS